MLQNGEKICERFCECFLFRSSFYCEHMELLLIYLYRKFDLCPKAEICETHWLGQSSEEPLAETKRTLIIVIYIIAHVASSKVKLLSCCYAEGWVDVNFHLLSIEISYPNNCMSFLTTWFRKKKFDENVCAFLCVVLAVLLKSDYWLLRCCVWNRDYIPCSHVQFSVSPRILSVPVCCHILYCYNPFETSEVKSKV